MAFHVMQPPRGRTPRTHCGAAGKARDARITIGSRTDRAERDANDAAARVVGDPGPRRHATVTDTAPAPDAGTAIANALASPGAPLPAIERAFLESRLGHHLDAVRIHRGPEADRASHAVHARAFTLGTDVVLGRGARPGAPGEKRVLAHELAHVAQAPEGRVLRREGGADAATEQEDDDAKPVVEGLKTVAGKLAKHEPVKEKIIKPIEKRAKAESDRLSTGEKAGLVAFGAATYGLALGPMLSTPAGRRHLSGVNFVAPLRLIPNWPVSSFSFTVPDTPSDPLKLDLKLDGSDLLKIGRESPTFATSLSVDAKWSVLPGGGWRLSGLTATFGLMKGLTVTGGFKQGPFLPAADIITGPGGEQVRSVKSIPPAAPDPLAKVPNIGAFITIDLTKLPIIPRQVRRVLGGDLGGGAK